MRQQNLNRDEVERMLRAVARPQDRPDVRVGDREIRALLGDEVEEIDLNLGRSQVKPTTWHFLVSR